MKKVLFFDIDGTLTNEKTGKIPESTYKALKQAKENGHLLFINTGRTYCRMVPEIRKLGVDGYLCGCGTYLTYHDKVFFEERVSKKTMDAIVKMTKECNTEAVFEGIENVYFLEEESRFDDLRNLRKMVESEGIAKRFSYGEKEYSFEKTYINSDEKSDLKRFLDFMHEFANMECIDRGHGAYECTLKGLSKATAMEMVYKKFGIDKENSYAFGDSSNDITMFQAAKHTVAMGTHSEILEPYTEFITKTVEDDGIEYALKHYGLI